jgi:hypothetical protein
MCGQHGTYGMQLFIEYILCYSTAFFLGAITGVGLFLSLVLGNDKREDN